MSLRSTAAIALWVAASSLVLGLSFPGWAAEWPSLPGSNAEVSATVYSQPPSPTGGLYRSSRNGTDLDRYVWDDFVISAGQAVAITEIQWRGGYVPPAPGSGGPVLDFRVAIYPSIAGGSQPDVIGGPLVAYLVGGNAGETLAGTFGGVVMYDYRFVLPTPFNATGPGKYWVQIEAMQGVIPDWGVSAGTGGNGFHFLGIAVAGDISYFIVLGDSAFTLLGSVVTQPRVYLPLISR